MKDKALNPESDWQNFVQSTLKKETKVPSMIGRPLKTKVPRQEIVNVKPIRTQNKSKKI